MNAHSRSCERKLAESDHQTFYSPSDCSGAERPSNRHPERAERAEGPHSTWMPSQRGILLLLTLLACAACATRRETRVPATRPITVPAERPGLGTSWGETRQSPVEPIAFGRASATRPSSKGLLYYNDREGIDAMLDYLGRDPRKVTGLRPAGDVSFALRGSDGQWLDSYELKGKRFSVGERGSRYEIVLKNDSPKPVEVLVSVDGLDTLDGEPARFDKRGYVLDANEELALEGFRQNDSEVAAFRFGGMGSTYAQRRHGTTENCGVVGIAIFREGRAQPPTKEQPRRHPKPLTIPATNEYAKPPPSA